MPITGPMTVVFRVAAGPRLGFGHLVRCRSLARALGVPPRVSIRGTAETRRRARAMGWLVVDEASALTTPLPSVLVIDDPSQTAARLWVRRARAAGIRVATLHDSGLAWLPESDLLVDGSIACATSRGRARLLGARFAVLDPALAGMRRHGGPRVAMRVVAALGGGAHAFGLIEPLAAALRRHCGPVELRVPRGFTRRRLPSLPHVTWVDAPHGLARELARAEVAIVAGGVTLYEACALGTPAVAIAIVPGQRRAVRAAARLGAVVQGGGPTSARDGLARVARLTAQLLLDPAARRRLTSTGQRLVDGRGAHRVANALACLVAKSAAPEVRRAA